MPQFDVNLKVENAMFRYPSLPAGVDAINIVAMVKNPGGAVDATTVVVNPFNFTLAGNPFSIKADVRTPVSDPEFNLVAYGKLDLGKIKDVYPMEEIALNGVVDADMRVAGRLSYGEQEQYEKVQASGSVKLSGMKLYMSGIPDVDIERSTLSFSPRYVELSQTKGNMGKNDITLDSRFENNLGFVFKGTTLKGTLNVASQMFNLNDFMSEDASAEAAAEEQAE